MLLVLNALNGVVAENNELRSCDMSAPPIFLFEFEKILTLTRKRFKRFCLRKLVHYCRAVRTGLERFLDDPDLVLALVSAAFFERGLGFLFLSFASASGNACNCLRTWCVVRWAA